MLDEMRRINHRWTVPGKVRTRGEAPHWSSSPFARPGANATTARQSLAPFTFYPSAWSMWQAVSAPRVACDTEASPKREQLPADSGDKAA